MNKSAWLARKFALRIVRICLRAAQRVTRWLITVVERRMRARSMDRLFSHDVVAEIARQAGAVLYTDRRTFGPLEPPRVGYKTVVAVRMTAAGLSFRSDDDKSLLIVRSSDLPPADLKSLGIIGPEDLCHILASERYLSSPLIHHDTDTALLRPLKFRLSRHDLARLRDG